MRWGVRRTALLVALAVASLLVVVTTGGPGIPFEESDQWTVSNPCSIDRTLPIEFSRAVNESDGESETVSNESAARWAYCAEERYLRSRLEGRLCVDGWGFEAYGGVDPAVRILDRGPSWVNIRSTHPVWWGTNDVSADSFSRATYNVTGEQCTRESGTDVRPCGGGWF